MKKILVNFSNVREYFQRFQHRKADLPCYPRCRNILPKHLRSLGSHRGVVARRHDFAKFRVSIYTPGRLLWLFVAVSRGSRRKLSNYTILRENQASIKSNRSALFDRWDTQDRCRGSLYKCMCVCVYAVCYARAMHLRIHARV